MTIVVTI